MNDFMNADKLYELLLLRQDITGLSDFVAQDQQQLDQLVEIALNDTNRETWRACWVMDKINEKKPELIQPYLVKIINALETINNPSKLRHLLKIISLNIIPEEKLSFLLDLSIKKLTDPSFPIAVRVHAMQILYAISEQEPEFKPELIQLIEHEMEYHASSGIKARGKNLLKKLYQSD